MTFEEEHRLNVEEDKKIATHLHLESEIQNDQHITPNSRGRTKMKKLTKEEEYIRLLTEENEDLNEALDELRFENRVLRCMLANEHNKQEVLVGIVPERQKIYVDNLDEVPSNGLVIEKQRGYVMFVKESDVPPKPLSGTDREWELE